MRGRSRPVAAVFAIVAFVFAQATTAAYACAGPITDPVAMAQMKAQMADDGGLCEKHCASGTVTFEVAKPAAFSMPAIAAAPARIVAIAAPPCSIGVPAARLSVAGPAPPLIRFTVLRI